jgi:hypothetical protein
VAISERTRRVWIALATTVCAAASAVSCRVDTPEGVVFACSTDAECGDDGAFCMPRPGRVSICCLPAPEVCDGKDNDCSGHPDDGIAPLTCYEGPVGTADVGMCRSGQRSCVSAQMTGCVGQILPRSETCNDVDDDCDGQIDEGPLDSDPNNCGACGNRCPPTHQCSNGACIPSAESRCDGNLDEDGDGLIDCADPDCNGRTCGAFRKCENLECISNSESNCENGLDEDGDARIDCADNDCSGQSCAAGCMCDAGRRTEINCQDFTDNDADGLTNCADVDDCSGVSCGTDCQCQNGVRTELNCSDSKDNDFDNLTDCQDLSDCINKSCLNALGRPGRCKQNRMCQ